VLSRGVFGRGCIACVPNGCIARILIGRIARILEQHRACSQAEPRGRSPPARAR